VILSVSTLIVVVSLVEGTNKYVADKIANFGANVYLVLQYPIVTNRETFLKLQRTNKKITWEDYEDLRDHLTLAKAVGLQGNRSGRVKYKTESIEGIEIRGVTANMGDIDIVEPALGRYISDTDDGHRANVTLIGSEVAKRFFAGLDPLGRSIYIDGEAFDVVGVAKELGSTFGQSQDNFVYMPIQTYRKIYGNNESLDIDVKALGPDLMQASEDEARALMRARRHLGAKQADTFGILEPSALMDLWQSLTGSLANGSIFVVGIFMGIGGIVIMNIMLASVTERTREIGVRKAVGATRRDVLLQFLIESAVMATIGGVLGILTAVAISFAISTLTPFPMSLPLRWVLIAIFIATSIGVFFGVYPAHKAAKLDPIEALRFEV
jgi:putative ABC transport system permease protein